MKNWKTSACGAVIAAVTAIQAYNGTDWKQCAVQVVVSIALFVAKDFNVTGGTK